MEDTPSPCSHEEYGDEFELASISDQESIYATLSPFSSASVEGVFGENDVMTPPSPQLETTVWNRNKGSLSPVLSNRRMNWNSHSPPSSPKASSHFFPRTDLRFHYRPRTPPSKAKEDDKENLPEADSEHPLTKCPGTPLLEQEREPLSFYHANPVHEDPVSPSSSSCVESPMNDGADARESLVPAPENGPLNPVEVEEEEDMAENHEEEEALQLQEDQEDEEEALQAQEDEDTGEDQEEVLQFQEDLLDRPFSPPYDGGDHSPNSPRESQEFDNCTSSLSSSGEVELNTCQVTFLDGTTGTADVEKNVLTLTVDYEASSTRLSFELGEEKRYKLCSVVQVGANKYVASAPDQNCLLLLTVLYASCSPPKCLSREIKLSFARPEGMCYDGEKKHLFVCESKGKKVTVLDHRHRIINEKTILIDEAHFVPLAVSVSGRIVTIISLAGDSLVHIYDHSQ